MPITQTRMIAVIKAGFDYKQGLETLLTLIKQQGDHLAAGHITPEQFLGVLLPSAKLQFLLTDPVQSAISLIGEEKHFRLHGKRNVNKARKVRENKAAEREGLSRPQRSSTAPTRIDQAHGQKSNLIRSTLLDHDPDMSGDLELGQYAMPEVILPPDYTPGPISEKQKQEIEQFGKEQDAAAKFLPLPGFATAPALCSHTFADEGEICRDCGTEKPIKPVGTGN